jgi:vacuolar-type H+-ATPase subunit F/Vma7
VTVAYAVAYVGNRLDAAGLRLAGVLALAPQPGEERAAFEYASAQAQVLLVTAEVAARLPAAQLEHALAAQLPMVAIVPEPQQAPSPLDPAERVRRILGLESQEEPSA